MCDKPACPHPPIPDSRYCAAHGPRPGHSLLTYLQDKKSTCRSTRAGLSGSCRCARYYLEQIRDTCPDASTRILAAKGIRAMMDKDGAVKI